MRKIASGARWNSLSVSCSRRLSSTNDRRGYSKRSHARTGQKLSTLQHVTGIRPHQSGVAESTRRGSNFFDRCFCGSTIQTSGTPTSRCLEQHAVTIAGAVHAVGATVNRELPRWKKWSISQIVWSLPSFATRSDLNQASGEPRVGPGEARHDRPIVMRITGRW